MSKLFKSFAMCFGLLLYLSVVLALYGCTTYHRYYPDPSEVFLKEGKFIVRVGDQAYPDDTPNNVVVVDSNGTSRFVCLEYYAPKGKSGCDFSLRIDSTFLRIAELDFAKDISKFQFSGSRCSELTASLCLPMVRLPSDKYVSEFELSFILFVLDSKTDALIERKPLKLTMTYQKDREIYQGR